MQREKDQARLRTQAFSKRKQELFTNHESLDEYHGVQKTENVQCASVSLQVILAVGDIDLEKESANVLEYESLSKEGLQGNKYCFATMQFCIVLLSKIAPNKCLKRKTWKRMQIAITVSESIVTVPRLQIAFPSNQCNKLINNVQSLKG